MPQCPALDPPLGMLVIYLLSLGLIIKIAVLLSVVLTIISLAVNLALIVPFLSNFMRQECLNSRYVYDAPLAVSRLVSRTGNSILYSQSSMQFLLLFYVAIKAFVQAFPVAAFLLFRINPICYDVVNSIVLFK